MMMKAPLRNLDSNPWFIASPDHPAECSAMLLALGDEGLLLADVKRSLDFFGKPVRLLTTGSWPLIQEPTSWRMGRLWARPVAMVLRVLL